MNWILDLAWKWRWQLVTVFVVAGLGWLAAELVVVHAGLDPNEVEVTRTLRHYAGQLAMLCGVWLLPAVFRYLDRNRDGKIDRRDFEPENDEPPSGGAGAAGASLLALVLAFGFLAVGCDDPHRPQAIVGEVLYTTSTAGGSAIMADRRANLVRAGEAARDAGEDIRTAVEAAAARWDGEHGDLVELHNQFAGAVNTYNRLAYAEAIGELDDLEQLRAAGAHVVETYNAVSRYLEQHPDVDAVIPRVPEWVIAAIDTGAAE